MAQRRRRGRPGRDADGAWKQVLRDLLPDCIAFIHHDLWRAIDWGRPPEFMDKELQAISRRAATGRRNVDLLARVWQHDGAEQWLLLHVEVQGQRQETFAERMYTYHALLVLQHQRPVISLALLTDPHPEWHPRAYGYDHWGCAVAFQFPTMKLLDWRGREAELAAMPNPFAQVALAHLAVLTSRGHLEPLAATQRAVLRHLLRSGYDRRRLEAVLLFLDAMLDLPEELTAAIDAEIAAEEGITVTRLLSRWSEQALAMGLEQGRELGIEQGRELGIEQGREAGERAVVLRQLERRCGPLDAGRVERVANLDSARLLALGDALLDFAGPDDLDRWLAANG